MESTAKPSRSTVADNYTQILKDLEDAINSGALEEEATPGYLNVWAAKALLSRVYLTMGNYSKALSVSEDIIEHSPYVLWTSAQYAKAWDKGDAAHGNEMISNLLLMTILIGLIVKVLLIYIVRMAIRLLVMAI